MDTHESTSHASDKRLTLTLTLTPTRYESTSHYSDKRLEQMTDRDWRIFREDFEIATKGNMRHPATGERIMPFRKWPESGLPNSILTAINKVSNPPTRTRARTLSGQSPASAQTRSSPRSTRAEYEQPPACPRTRTVALAPTRTLTRTRALAPSRRATRSRAACR